MKRRPAEKAGAGASGIVAIVAAVQGHDLLTALAFASALVPAVATWIVDHGGVTGVARAFWGGRA